MKDLLTIVYLQLCVLFGSFSPSATAMALPAVHTQTFKTYEPNLYAPHLYADKINLLATLVDSAGGTEQAKLLGAFVSTLFHSRG
jgi:hypothetical protein